MPDSNTPYCRTPLHAWHAAHGGRFIERDGWQVVAAYTTSEREAEAARTGLGLADISSFADISPRAGIWLLGPPWDVLLRRLMQLDLRATSFPVGAHAETALAGVEALLVRSAELSVPSVRIVVSWDVADFIWERLLVEGSDLGITPVGVEALGKVKVSGTFFA